MDDNQMGVDHPIDCTSSEMDQSSLLNQSSLINIDSSDSQSNNTMDSSMSSLSSTNSDPLEDQMECMIVDENVKSNGSNSNSSLNKMDLSATSNGKSKKPKRTKEELEKEKQEREARKAKEAEEKRKRKAEREKRAEISRQRKEEKRKEIEENRRLREQKRIEKEKELEEKKRIADELKRVTDQKRAEKEAEKELRKRERDEKKRAEEEEKNKKKQAEEAKSRKQLMIISKFQSFFHKVSPEQKKKPKIGNLELQKDQSIANYIPEISKENFVMGAFDSQIIHQDAQVLYLNELRNKTHKPYRHRKSKQISKIDDVVINGSQNESKTYRAKLLQFHENLRPAYFGTWRKKSKYITGRRPLEKESDLFDYEVESDLEWVEEEEGEIIKDSDSEKDKLEDEEEDQEDGDDYELDDFFVPHGHLSDDENQDDEHCEVIEEPDGQKKRKLLTKEKILIEERTKKLKRLVPKATGCLWMTNDEFENKAKFSLFEKYKVVFVN